MHDDHDDEHDLGLAHDLGVLRERRLLLPLVDRRRALGLLGFGALVLAGCSSGEDVSASSTTTGPSGSGNPPPSGPGGPVGPPPSGGGGPGGPPGGGGPQGGGVRQSGNPNAIPNETAGPYPGDGSNGPNALTESGIVRKDITSSFGSAKGKASGVPLTIKLSIVSATGQTPLAGAAVYLWHCDAAGRYSLYSDGVTKENYLRGVQAAGTDGVVEFTSIYPAAYSGRWPHIHFEVFTDQATALAAGTRLATSQVALPEDTSKQVYAGNGYDGSTRNLSQVTLANDNVFSDDGGVKQLGKVTGSVASGLTVSLLVPVAT